MKMLLSTLLLPLLFLTGCLDKSSWNPIRRQALEELVQHFRVYDAQDAQGMLTLKRIGRDYDGGYVVAEKSLKKADALMGYGIADDISFEEDFCKLYGKPAYGFDGGVQSVASREPLFRFFSESISSDKFLYKEQTSSGKVSTFGQQIARLGLNNKKIFIKMDIEGAEYDAFVDIHPHSAHITGIVLELHFKSLETIKKAIKLLSTLDKDFVLVRIHGNNACGGRFKTKSVVSGKVPYMLELTYINKNLLTAFAPSKNQKHPQSLDMPNIKSRPDANFEISL